MTPSGRAKAPRSKMDGQVDAVMDAARVLVAVVAQSVAEVEDTVSLPQLRVLVMVHRHGQLNLSAVAAGLGVHSSTASRTCDPLVRSGLLARADLPHDRRHLSLTLTGEGRRLVDSVLDHRRRAVKDVVRRLPASRRDSLASALEEFAAAAGDFPADQAAALGWTH
ncbi:MAG TPA: MarR family transcriptional regulator [Nocardioidaceae bacterium]|nr:MarR family transcriptional regulator [Nocardioidaceae bacterium]